MSTFTNINAPVPNPAAAPSTNVITAAGDDFVALTGAKYLLRFTNGSATPGNVKVTDPNTPAPVGNTAFDASVTVPVPAGQSRTLRLDASRFRDSSTGKISWTYSANITNAASLVEIYGPE